MKQFVIFFTLNSRFVLKEEGESAEEVKARISEDYGIHEKFLEVIEKSSKSKI